MTPKEFLLKKYPPDTFYDCPVPKEYWKDMQEFSDANNRQLAEQNKELMEACKAYVELFRETDMRPEDECNELLYKMQAAIKNAETN